MMPPAYPRVPHLVEGRGTRDDLQLSAPDIDRLLDAEVAVEEKLDGANVVLWLESGGVEVSLRSGADAMDRAGQIGRLRAWVSERAGQLTPLLTSHSALYAEWLYLTHSVAYDRLPSLLVGLDLTVGQNRFVAVAERNRRLAQAGIAPPPELARGRPITIRWLEGWLGPSRFGVEPAEGLVVRTLDGGAPRIAKVLRPGFERRPDAAWRGDQRRNLTANATIAQR
jgi:hypothetical protein